MQDLPTPRLVETIRSHAGLTQEGLARQLGVSFATVNAWERGRSEPRRTRRLALERLAESVVEPVTGRRAGGEVVVLVVDDDPVARHLVETMVRRAAAGSTVHLASGGIEGLLLCGAVRPDVLFLDVMMPDLDGVEVARRIHDIAGLEDVAVVLMTASDDPAVLRRARRSSADAVLTKPLAPQQVADLIERADRDETT